MPERHISGIRPRFQGLSQSQGQVTHVLLTRSPLIHPANWASPFDLHVLSTPPAFVLSQNQTLRRCLMATTTRKRRSTDTRNDPHPLASGDQSIRLLRKPPDGVGNDFRINQDPPTPNNHPRTGATTRADEPSWHQLLRHTVEFSKNRRASLTHPCGLCDRRLLSQSTRVPGSLCRSFRRLACPKPYQSFQTVFPGC